MNVRYKGYVFFINYLRKVYVLSYFDKILLHKIIKSEMYAVKILK